MLPFGHMGIGSKLVTPWSRGLPRSWLLLGTLLPDLIDKPIYYGLVALTGRHGIELGLISGTRTFGHTALLLMLVTLGVAFLNSRRGAALALGMATHLFLDNLGDGVLGALLDQRAGAISTVHALLWPLLGPQFPIAPFGNVRGHLAVSANPVAIGAEVAGVLLLAWDQWQHRHESEILAAVRERRLLGKLRKRRRRG